VPFTCWGSLRVGGRERAEVVGCKAAVGETGVQFASRRIIDGTDRTEIQIVGDGYGIDT
jgi:hypothetical protein